MKQVKLVWHMITPILEAIGAALGMILFLAMFLFFGHAMGFH